MRNLITILILFVAVGCSKSLTEEEKKVVGSYKRNFEGTTDKLVLHENRVFEGHKNGEKQADGTWKIVGKEVHFGSEKGAGGRSGWAVFKIESNGELSWLGEIDGGKRTEFPKEEQPPTFKKIK